MIYDSIKNIATYKSLSEDIYQGLMFLQNATPDIANGVYEITPRVKAIVSEYETKPENVNGYEAHKEYIDIQYLLAGEERIASLPIEWLTETKPYSQENDCALYSAVTIPNPSSLIPNPSYLTLLPGYFAVFYPQDGHMPQLCVTTPVPVKKVVVKVKV